MNLENYRRLFIAASLVLMLVAFYPALNVILPFSSGGERFSEFWILGPNHQAKDYPFNVRVNESYSVFVDVANHMGVSSYYLVYVKFRNETQPLPNATTSLPSPLPPLQEFRAFAADGETWETSLTFRILEASCRDDSMFIGRLSINDLVFPVNSSATWDSEFSGFYYQMFFELWFYNVSSKAFQFHNRLVGIWLNVTT